MFWSYKLPGWICNRNHLRAGTRGELGLCRWAALARRVQLREGFTTPPSACSINSSNTIQGQGFPKHCRTHPFLGMLGKETAERRGCVRCLACTEALNLLDLPWASVDYENYMAMLCSSYVLSSVQRSEIGKGENRPQMFAVGQHETLVASIVTCNPIQNPLTSGLENRKSDKEFIIMSDKDLQKCSLEHPLPGASVSFLRPSVTALLTVSRQYLKCCKLFK